MTFQERQQRAKNLIDQAKVAHELQQQDLGVFAWQINENIKRELEGDPELKSVFDTISDGNDTPQMTAWGTKGEL